MALAQSAPQLTAQVNGNVVTLTWTAPVGASPTAYLIEAGSRSGQRDLVRTFLPTLATQLVTPLPDGLYFVRVTAFYLPATFYPSNEVQVAVGCTGPPGPPAPPIVTQGAGGSPVHFSWSPPAGPVSAYRLEVGSSAGSANLAVLTLPSSTLSFSSPAPPGNYFVRLRAQNGCGMSSPSTDVVVSVGNACVAPSTQLLTYGLSGNVLSLSWQSAVSATPPVSYTLLAGTSPGASNIGAFPVGSATSFQAAVPNGSYFIRVVASNACGVSQASNEVNAVVGGTQQTAAELYNEGVILWNQGRIAEAKVKFEAAIAVDPTFADAYYLLGMAELNAGNIPAARVRLQQYLALAPQGQFAAMAIAILAQLG